MDFSMHAARNLAQIEHQNGVKSTFFILPHSEYYNLFEKEITDLVKEIIALGHEIGLHFDSHYYGINNEKDLNKYLLQEKRWLEEIFKIDIKVFSFHVTTPFTMTCEAWTYAGLINTYASYFKENVEYCSDSHGRWRFKRLKELLAEASAPCLHILTHPEWWQQEPMSPWQKIDRCVSLRAEKNREFYKAALVKLNTPNIDW